ncbi:SDR family oxidoreductase [Gammaproteobacteria bacterium]|nr:SDR family oxidoreductase [Gammaproteobacteria bacterium]
MKTTKEYSEKTVLVTGAARGIGLGIARRLGEEGAHVLIADINSELGLEVIQSLRKEGISADFIFADLSVSGGAITMVDVAAKVTGRIDVLVNNARAGRRVGLLEETEENWNLSLNVGLTAAFFASQATIRLMADCGGCQIINVGSVAAIQVTLESPSYHASKAGLLQLTKYLAVAGGPFHAYVNCVLPGLIVQEEHRPRFNSEGNEFYRSLAKHYQPLGEVGSEQDVAEAILYLCSDRARYVSGTCLTVDGGATTQEPLGLLLGMKQSKDNPIK